METYTMLRHFADSWMVVALMAFFIGVIVWVFRPSRRRLHDDAANSIFRNERTPAHEDRTKGDPTFTNEARK